MIALCRRVADRDRFQNPVFAVIVGNAAMRVQLEEIEGGLRAPRAPSTDPPPPRA
jgi:hypothetical protein